MKIQKSNIQEKIRLNLKFYVTSDMAWNNLR